MAHKIPFLQSQLLPQPAPSPSQNAINLSCLLTHLESTVLQPRSNADGGAGNSSPLFRSRFHRAKVAANIQYAAQQVQQLERAAPTPGVKVCGRGEGVAGLRRRLEGVVRRFREIERAAGALDEERKGKHHDQDDGRREGEIGRSSSLALSVVKHEGSGGEERGRSHPELLPETMLDKDMTVRNQGPVSPDPDIIGAFSDTPAEKPQEAQEKGEPDTEPYRTSPSPSPKFADLEPVAKPPRQRRGITETTNIPNPTTSGREPTSASHFPLPPPPPPPKLRISSTSPLPPTPAPYSPPPHLNRSHTDSPPTTNNKNTLTADQDDQEALTASLVSLAALLKSSTHDMHARLEADRSLLDVTLDTMNASATNMTQTGQRVGVLRQMSEGKGWWGRVLLYAVVAGLWVVALVVMLGLPKLRF